MSIEVWDGTNWRRAELVGLAVSSSKIVPLEFVTATAGPPDPDPDPDPPADPGIGVVGNRPAITTRPGPSNTGPRLTTTQTLSGAQALSAAMSAPIEADGKQYLRRARVTSNMAISNVGTRSLVFEDCVFDVTATMPLYAITAWQSVGDPEPTHWPEFRYCEVAGGSVATFRGGFVRFLRCNLHRGDDILKPWNGMEVWGSWLHDPWKAPESHCDIIQIRGGCSGALFHYNYFYGRTHPDSPAGFDWTSGVTQTGSTTTHIGQPDPVRFTGNWVEGGRYGYRGSGGPTNNAGGYLISQIYRNNRFIRDSFQYGPYTDMDPVNEDFDSSNVWDDNGLPVLT